MSCDPNQLINAARCWFRCVPGGMMLAVKNYLLCQAAQGGGGGGGGGVQDFVWDMDDTYTKGFATWSGAPVGTTSAEIWTSADGISYVLSDTVANPDSVVNSADILMTGNPFYAKMRFITGGSATAFTTPQSFNAGAKHSARVIDNGGAALGVSTILAENTFVSSLITAGLWGKFYAIGTVAPDGIIAVASPLVKVAGIDPWINNGFGGGALSVNGLQGDGVHFFNVGFSPQTIQGIAGAPDPASSFGIDFNTSLATNSNTIEVGAEGGDVNSSISLLIQFGGTCYWDCPYDGAAGRISFGVPNGERLTMGNRSAGNAQQTYEQRIGLFFTRVTGANNEAGKPVSASNFYWMATNRAVSTLTSDKRCSYVAWRQGFTLAEAQAYAPIVQTLRVGLGGGNT